MRSLQQEIIGELHTRSAIDPAQEVRMRIQFIKDYVRHTQTEGLVLGISGGQDSSLAGRLCQLAVEELRAESNQAYRFIAMRLPYGIQQDEADAERALRFIQPDQTLTVNIREAVDATVHAFQEATGDTLSDYVKGNAKARERMKVQYAVAGAYNLLVVGTDHAAEAVTGFFTKFGDGACDLIPLFGLNKRQGKACLKHLGAEAAIYEKVPTADLLDQRPGQSDEAELGIPYTAIDDYLEGKMIDPVLARRMEEKYLATRHKRTVPVSPFDNWWKS